MNPKIWITLATIWSLSGGALAAPVVGSANRTVEHPQPNQPIAFAASITDVGTVSGAVIHIDTNYPTTPGTESFTAHNLALDSGDTWTVSLPAQADKTYVKWYLEATNADSETVRYPATGFNVFLVDSNPVDENDLVISELIADPYGADATAGSEWLEYHNLTDRELDLSYFLTGNYPTGPNARALPEGTKIAPNDYLVVAGNKTLFLSHNPSVNPDKVVNIGWAAAVLPNSGGTTNNAFVAHVNEREWVGGTVRTIPFCTIPYINGQGDWPSWATTNSNTTSFQLANTSLDFTDGLNWNMSPVATPGAPNRVIPSAGPTVHIPQPNTPVVVEASVENWATAVKVHYRELGATNYTTADMTPPSAGTIWTFTLPGYADKTVVEWYIEATAPEGAVLYPFNAASNPLSFITETNPLGEGAVVINELVYNPQGGDNGTYQEWVELYNPHSTPRDLSGMVFGRNLTVGDAWEVRLPAGTIIPAQEYLVLAARKDPFMAIYGSAISADKVFDLQWQDASVFNNTAGNANLRHASINLRSALYIDQVPYDINNGWPTEGDNSGPTIELINPALDNSVPHNWRTAVGDSYAGAVRGTPGYQNSTFSSDLGILIQGTARDIQYPNSSDIITITANVQISSALSSAQLFVDAGTGSGFISVPMTVTSDPGVYSAQVGPYPDPTHVRYYVEFTDTSNQVSLYPEAAPAEVEVFLVKDGTPLGSNDLVINEVQADPAGGDNSASAEWLEIMNLRNEPIDLSYFVLSPKTALGSDRVVLPPGTIVPARGYLIVTGNKSLFLSEYEGTIFTFEDHLVVDGNWFASSLTNGSNTVSFRHVNAWGYTGAAGNPIDSVAYDTAVIGVGNNGLTAELKKPTLNNANTTNFAASLIKGGTPGAVNSQFRPVLMTISRDLEFPKPTETVNFTVTAQAVEDGATVAGVSLFVATNGGSYTEHPMTLAGENWVVNNIGPFAEGTLVSYYAVGTDSFGDASAEPSPYADHHFDYLVLAAGNTVQPGQVVINEIMYDNVGSDAYEYVELYNTTGADIDLSYFRFVDNELRPYVFPQGSTIAANGYVVMTFDQYPFRAYYGNANGVPIHDWKQQFNLANQGDVIRLVHPNQYQPGVSITPVEQVQYAVTQGWPTWEGAPSNTMPEAPNVLGRSIELINPGMSDRGTNGARWGWSTNQTNEEPSAYGTPGAQNSIYSPDSSVRDWSVY